MSNIYILRPMATNIDSLKEAKFFSNYDAMMESFGPAVDFLDVTPSNEGRNGWFRVADCSGEDCDPRPKTFYWRRIKVND